MKTANKLKIFFTCSTILCGIFLYIIDYFIGFQEKNFSFILTLFCCIVFSISMSNIFQFCYCDVSKIYKKYKSYGYMDALIYSKFITGFLLLLCILFALLVSLFVNHIFLQNIFLLLSIIVTIQSLLILFISSSLCIQLKKEIKDL